MSKKAETLFDFVTLGLDEIIVDETKNIRKIKKAGEPRFASFMASMGENGIPTVKVGEKTAKGHQLFYGYQRIGAATYIRDFHALVKEMIPIRDREEKEGVDLKEDREALEKKYGTRTDEFIAWKDAEATKEKLAELRGSPETDAKGNVTPFTLPEIAELLAKWEEKTSRIPAQVTDEKDPFERKLQQINENMERMDLTAGEEAQAVSDLVEHLIEKKIDKIAAMTMVGHKLGGRSLSWVQQSVSILKASAPVQEALQAGDVTKSQALAIVREKSVKGQGELLEKAKKGATVRALEKARKPAETKNNASKKKTGAQTRLVKGASLTTKVGKAEVKVEEGDDGEFTVNVDGESTHAFTVTKKGAIKVSGSASEILNVKTDLGHVLVQHDASTEGRFSIDVDGVEVAEFILDGKGDVEFKSIPVDDRVKGAPAKGKKKSEARKAKATKATAAAE